MATAQKINITEFRAHISHYKALVQAGACIEVTEHGHTAFVVTSPMDEADAACHWLQSLSGKARIHDVESPSGEAWSAQDNEKDGRL